MKEESVKDPILRIDVHNPDCLEGGGLVLINYADFAALISRASEHGVNLVQESNALGLSVFLLDYNKITTGISDDEFPCVYLEEKHEKDLAG